MKRARNIETKKAVSSSQRRARLSQARSRATRKAIVNAAEQLWGSMPFDDVSVSAICEVAGASKGSFYFHFPRKEHLLVMMMFDQFLPRRRNVESLLETDAPTAAVLEKIVLGVTTRARKLDKGLLLRAIEESFQHYREIGQLPGGDHSLSWYLRQVFVRGRHRKEVSQGWDPDTLASGLGWSLLQALLLWGGGKLKDRNLASNMLERAELVANGAATPRREAVFSP